MKINGETLVLQTAGPDRKVRDRFFLRSVAKGMAARQQAAAEEMSSAETRFAERVLASSVALEAASQTQPGNMEFPMTSTEAHFAATAASLHLDTARVERESNGQLSTLGDKLSQAVLPEVEQFAQLHA
jgi:hypothetical protein